MSILRIIKLVAIIGVTVCMGLGIALAGTEAGYNQGDYSILENGDINRVLVANPNIAGQKTNSVPLPQKQQ